MSDEQNSIELFKHADDKIERIKNEVGVLLQKDLELTLKIDRLQDRIDNGVSITGQKTLDMVKNIGTQIATFATSLEKQEIIVKNHDEAIKSINNSFRWVAVCGVIGGLISLFYLIMAGIKGLHS